MKPQGLYDVLERLCNLLRVEARTVGATQGMQPIQLEALYYLARCNRYSDTVQGVTEYFGQTKGTISQSLRVLEREKLIRKQTDVKDRRLIHLSVTPAGQRMLEKAIPPQPLTKALSELSDSSSESLIDGLRALLRAAQLAGGTKSFAACKTCRFNQILTGGSKCGLTGEPLTASDVERICREHEFPTSEPEISQER